MKTAITAPSILPLNRSKKEALEVGKTKGRGEKGSRSAKDGSRFNQTFPEHISSLLLWTGLLQGLREAESPWQIRSTLKKEARPRASRPRSSTPLASTPKALCLLHSKQKRLKMMGFRKMGLFVINMGKVEVLFTYNHEKVRLSSRFLFALFMFIVNYYLWDRFLLETYKMSTPCRSYVNTPTRNWRKLQWNVPAYYLQKWNCKLHWEHFYVQQVQYVETHSFLCLKRWKKNILNLTIFGTLLRQGVSNTYLSPGVGQPDVINRWNIQHHC